MRGYAPLDLSIAKAQPALYGVSSRLSKPSIRCWPQWCGRFALRDSDSRTVRSATVVPLESYPGIERTLSPLLACREFMDQKSLRGLRSMKGRVLEQFDVLLKVYCLNFANGLRTDFNGILRQVASPPSLLNWKPQEQTRTTERDRGIADGRIGLLIVPSPRSIRMCVRPNRS